MIAKEIGEAGVGVILIPSRPFPMTWKSKRMSVSTYHEIWLLLILYFSLPGPPLSQDSAISVLMKHGVTVGLGIEEQWSARSTPFDVGWVRLVYIFLSFSGLCLVAGCR